MSHANAALTPRARLRLARLVVDDGWTQSAAAKMFMVSPRTAGKWAADTAPKAQQGWPTAARDRTRARPRPARAGAQIVRLRWRHRLGPVQIGGRLGMPASTVHAVLVRCRINRLSRIDRVTGEPLRRYEHDHPGSLIHVDVTKFGNIPDGGGHKFVGRQPAEQDQRHGHRATHRRARQAPMLRPEIGIAYLHTVIDDHSRVAYAEICTDEKAVTAIGVLRTRWAWFMKFTKSIAGVDRHAGSHACWMSTDMHSACQLAGGSARRPGRGRRGRRHHLLASRLGAPPR